MKFELFLIAVIVASAASCQVMQYRYEAEVAKTAIQANFCRDNSQQNRVTTPGWYRARIDTSLGQWHPCKVEK